MFEDGGICSYKLTIGACGSRIGVCAALDGDTLVIERVLLLAVRPSLTFGWTSPVDSATPVIESGNASGGNRGV